jgi:hypothetical protein
MFTFNKQKYHLNLQGENLMKNIKLLISASIVVLALSIVQTIHSMEYQDLKEGEQVTFNMKVEQPEKQDDPSVRVSRIDECISQYNALGASHLTYQNLRKIFGKLRSLYGVPEPYLLGSMDVYNTRLKAAIYRWSHDLDDKLGMISKDVQENQINNDVRCNFSKNWGIRERQPDK